MMITKLDARHTGRMLSPVDAPIRAHSVTFAGGAAS
jgi:hypothetical protein